MGMVVERSGPRVAHRQDARRPTDPRAILGDELYRRRCFVEERTVHDALMPLRHVPQRRGEGKGEQIANRTAAAAPGRTRATAGRDRLDTWDNGDCDRSDTGTRARRSDHSDTASATRCDNGMRIGDMSQDSP
jgi:hypothetical protein